MCLCHFLSFAVIYHLTDVPFRVWANSPSAESLRQLIFVLVVNLIFELELKCNNQCMKQVLVFNLNALSHSHPGFSVFASSELLCVLCWHWTFCFQVKCSLERRMGWRMIPRGQMLRLVPSQVRHTHHEAGCLVIRNWPYITVKTRC